MKLIVGLGNPEDKYDGTRHNLGFNVLDHFVTKHLPVKISDNNFWKKESRFKALVGKIEDSDLLLIKPQTYMNLSGLSVASSPAFLRLNRKILS